MEDALSLRDALDAALMYRVVRTADGVVFQIGDAEDDLMTLDEAVLKCRFALEIGHRLVADETEPGAE